MGWGGGVEEYMDTQYALRDTNFLYAIYIAQLEICIIQLKIHNTQFIARNILLSIYIHMRVPSLSLASYLLGRRKRHLDNKLRILGNRGARHYYRKLQLPSPRLLLLTPYGTSMTHLGSHSLATLQNNKY